MSVTLGVQGGLAAAAAFYSRALGLRLVQGEEASEAHVRQSSSAVLAFGPVHNTTTLVLEQASREPGATAQDCSDSSLVLAVEVPDVAAAQSCFEQSGLPVSSSGAPGSSFTALCPEGYTFCVSKLQQEARELA